jgi:multidrug resistance efflux pump
MPTDTDPGYLDVTPPHWAARGVAYVLIALFIAAGIIAIVVRVPETVSSRFVLVPVRGTDPIRASHQGTVLQARVTDGEVVPAGHVLFVLRSSMVAGEAAELQTLETQLAGGAEALSNARKRYESQRAADEEEARRLASRAAFVAQKIDTQRDLRTMRETKYQTNLQMLEREVEGARTEVEFKKTQLALAQDLAERLKRGYENGFLSWIEYIRPQIELKKTAADLEQLERQMQLARLRVDQLKTERQTQEAEWRSTMDQLETEQKEVRGALEKLRHEMAARQTEMREAERRLREDTEKATIRSAALKGELIHTRGNELSVVAPCGGTVLRLAIKAPGAVVHDGDVMGEIACAGERLQAELTVPQIGVGRIKPGQGVKLMYDAFPYERYGVRQGTVRWVSPAAVAGKDAGNKDQVTFRALAEVVDDTIRVDGQPRPIAAGMGGRADVVIGRRTLLAYAFEPIRRLKENLADAPAR